MAARGIPSRVLMPLQSVLPCTLRESLMAELVAMLFVCIAFATLGAMIYGLSKI